MTHNHEHQVGKTSFEKNLCSHILDEQVNPVYGEIHAGVEGEKLEDLSVEIDFGREILNFDVNFANMHRSLRFISATVRRCVKESLTFRNTSGSGKEDETLFLVFSVS